MSHTEKLIRSLLHTLLGNLNPHVNQNLEVKGNYQELGDVHLWQGHLEYFRQYVKTYQLPIKAI